MTEEDKSAIKEMKDCGERCAKAMQKLVAAGYVIQSTINGDAGTFEVKLFQKQELDINQVLKGRIN